MKELEDNLLHTINSINCFPNEAQFYIDELSRELKSSNVFSQFFGNCHSLGNFNNCFDGENEFTRLLIGECFSFGIETTVENLGFYLDRKEFELGMGMLLYGTHIEDPFTFSNGVTIISTDDLSDLTLKDHINTQSMSIGGFNSAILISNYKVSKSVYSTTGNQSNSFPTSIFENQNKAKKELEDIRLMLTLVRKTLGGIPYIGFFEIIPPNLRFLSPGVTQYPSSEPRLQHGGELIHIHLSYANELFEKFRNMNEGDQEKLRIAIKRLNDSKIDSNRANECIYLRICLENLFCIPDKDQIVKNIKERGALFTNYSEEELKAIYRHLSCAIHTGLRSENQDISDQEIASEIRDVILKYLEMGKYPDWN